MSTTYTRGVAHVGHFSVVLQTDSQMAASSILKIITENKCRIYTWFGLLYGSNIRKRILSCLSSRPIVTELFRL